MRESSKILLDNYQIRRTEEQKNNFINWLKSYLLSMDYNLKVDNYRKGGNNLIVGDIEKAKIILTAHYDTSINSFVNVSMTIGNPFMHVLSTLPPLLPIFLISFLIRFFIIASGYYQIAYFIIIVMFILLFLFIFLRKPNVNNANDNTSGIATLLAIMEDIPSKKRDEICFVFFDEEEKGLIGSINFKKKYNDALTEKMLFNFDCVANGNNFLFVVKKTFEKSNNFNSFQNIINSKRETEDLKTFTIGGPIEYIYPSDQSIFNNGIGVAALKKKFFWGLYLDDIHSKKDTTFQIENIEILKNIFIEFIQTL